MVKNKSMKLRHEFKYSINRADYLVLKARLKTVAKIDPHASEDGTYQIRSLYFDNFQDKALREKIDGVDCREKFRIRYYNGDLSYIKLEKKIKIHGLCGKRSTYLTKEQCKQILVGEIDWMKKSKDPLLVELYCKMNYLQLKPRVIVDYWRDPFVYKTGNVRVTIDHHIQTGLYSQDMFDQNLHTIIVPDDQMILEVKYDEFLPEIIAEMVQLKGRRLGAYSKYAACRMYG